MKDLFENIDPRVEEAMKRLNRADFVPDVLKDSVGHDRPVPIGFGQTCSQPRLVAYMTDLLQIGDGSLVFEIGTGSGFQTALLLELGCTVYSMDIFEELALPADERLRKLDYSNFDIRVGDGSYGWPEDATFDACIFTCATKEFPNAVLKQLKIGGRAVYPLEIGQRTQNLMVGVKNENCELISEFTTSVLFVPLLNKRK